MSTIVWLACKHTSKQLDHENLSKMPTSQHTTAPGSCVSEWSPGYCVEPGHGVEQGAPSSLTLACSPRPPPAPGGTRLRRRQEVMRMLVSQPHVPVSLSQHVGVAPPPTHTLPPPFSILSRPEHCRVSHTHVKRQAALLT